MKIIHLSDLHLNKKTKKERIIQTLEKICKEEPGAIVISGDLINIPYTSSLQKAEKFVNYLKKRFPVICVPGNTDYTTMYESEETQIPDKENTKEQKIEIENFQIFPEPIYIPGNKKRKLIHLGNNIKIKDTLFGLVKEKKGIVVYENADLYTKTFGATETTISVNGINFVGFDSHKDIGITLLGEATLKNQDPTKIYLTELKDGHIEESHLEKRLNKLSPELNIAVMHHPILPIVGANTIYGYFSQMQRVITTLLKKEIQMSLCGHKHIPGVTQGQIKGKKDKNFYVCATGTLFSSDIKKPFKDNSYNIIIIEDNKVTVDYKEISSNNSTNISSFSLI